MSAGGWFLCRRMGEQVLLGRGQPQIAPLGERMFRPSDRFVDFCLGTDPHGFFMATLHGNGIMPFVHVTLNEVPINTWNQLVAVKAPDGFRAFGMIAIGRPAGPGPEVDRFDADKVRTDSWG